MAKKPKAEEPKRTPEEKFEAFRRLLKAIVQVPKKEIKTQPR